jgi:23S rRNA pseudouridine2605 synthase
MCEAVGHPIVALTRVRFGPIRDESLRPGQWRVLTTSEISQLRKAARLS